MRGFFGIGVQGLSKPMNAGNLFRSAHAFGASFVFTIDSVYARSLSKSDTSNTPEHLPFYQFDTVADLTLPDGCSLVGIELTDAAVDLPSFHHPPRAAYVLGRERGSLTSDLIARCETVVKIPTKFCINVAVAGAVVMYDRLISRGRFASRPLGALADAEPPADHVHGGPIVRSGTGAKGRRPANSRRGNQRKA